MGRGLFNHRGHREEGMGGRITQRRKGEDGKMGEDHAKARRGKEGEERGEEGGA